MLYIALLFGISFCQEIAETDNSQQDSTPVVAGVGGGAVVGYSTHQYLDSKTPARAVKTIVKQKDDVLQQVKKVEKKLNQKLGIKSFEDHAWEAAGVTGLSAAGGAAFSEEIANIGIFQFNNSL